MKKIIILLAAAAMSALACSKSNEAAKVTGPRIDDTTVEPVVFTSSVSGVHTSTKSAGALDDWSGADSLFVYAIERGTSGYVFDNIFIDNIFAYSPSAGLDGHRGSIELYNPSAAAAGEPFYYGEGYYDFFGYYVDDAAVSRNVDSADDVADGTPVTVIDEDNQRITLDVAIDGAQDILIARADSTADIALAKTSYTGTINPGRVYSAYSARRSVVPNLQFKHQLSRFKFEIISGSQIVADAVYVTGISINSPSEATYAVAGAFPEDTVTCNLIDSSATKYLGLKHIPEGGSSLVVLDEADANRVKCPAFNSSNPTRKTIDGSLLVIPGKDKYSLKLNLYQEGVSTGDGAVERDLEIDFSSSSASINTIEKKGIAGYEYTVTIYVYSLEEVKVDVSLTDWKSGGSFDIDPDKD